MNRISPNRREFLRAGAVGLGALLAPSLFTRHSSAQVGERPRRLVVFINSFGTIDARWRMRPGGASSDANFQRDLGGLGEADFSEILRPLHRVREHVTIVEGLAQLVVPFGREGDLHAIGHHPSQAVTTTGGSWYVPESERSVTVGSRAVRTNHASIDQVVADAVQGDGRLRSLALGSSGYVYREGGVWVPAESSATAVFDRLFGAPAEPGDDARERALGLVAQELDAMSSRLGQSNREILSRHRDLVVGLRDRLAAGTLSCEGPELLGERHLDFFRIIAAAFACDATRVATYNISRLEPREFGEASGLNVHQDLAHRENGDPTNAASATMARMYRVIAERFRDLVELLAATPEPGHPDESLLDNTAVVWMTEQTNGEHDWRKVPYVIAGRCGGAIRTGRYLHYAQNLELTRNDGGVARTSRYYRAHNHALVSIAQAMGLSTDTVGLTEIQDLNGRVVSLRGGLPELLA